MDHRSRHLQALTVAALVGLLAWTSCAAPPAATPPAATAPGGAAPAPRDTAAVPASAAQPPALERVKISTAGQSMTTMPIQIANLKGFFVAEGVEVEMVY